MKTAADAFYFVRFCLLVLFAFSGLVISLAMLERDFVLGILFLFMWYGGTIVAMSTLQNQ